MSPAPAVAPAAADLPIEGKTVKAITLLSLKRTHDLFVSNHGQKVPVDEDAQRVKIACKVGSKAAFPDAPCWRGGCAHPVFCVLSLQPRRCPFPMQCR